jgi:hypothetical protein
MVTMYANVWQYCTDIEHQLSAPQSSALQCRTASCAVVPVVAALYCNKTLAHTSFIHVTLVAEAHHGNVTSTVSPDSYKLSYRPWA